ncbi:unnamed protein product [Vitrella brassicaformis CCMP3155]|uniref:Uncharacterized protein n=2 Tax=Vitrella brassicaformis TaxID=1169539 RepID=A0A0G4EG88_VITBC|nr:unnamed protein product [Vitrella brassicaformis CCMP3155]|eukprot:CEL94722.1 unnamed protein product [Vitrella brassicaformis CCMP3155]
MSNNTKGGRVAQFLFGTSAANWSKMFVRDLPTLLASVGGIMVVSWCAWGNVLAWPRNIYREITGDFPKQPEAKTPTKPEES